MNKDSLRNVITDSVSTEIQKSGEIYQTILTEQHETYELIVYIWIAITAILISGTLFWNFYLSSKRIKDEIDKRESEIEKSLKKFIEGKIESIIDSNKNFKVDIDKKLEESQKESVKSLIRILKKVQLISRCNYQT